MIQRRFEKLNEFERERGAVEQLRESRYPEKVTASQEAKPMSLAQANRNKR